MKTSKTTNLALATAQESTRRSMNFRRGVATAGLALSAIVTQACGGFKTYNVPIGVATPVMTTDTAAFYRDSVLKMEYEKINLLKETGDFILSLLFLPFFHDGSNSTYGNGGVEIGRAEGPIIFGCLKGRNAGSRTEVRDTITAAGYEFLKNKKIDRNTILKFTPAFGACSGSSWYEELPKSDNPEHLKALSQYAPLLSGRDAEHLVKQGVSANIANAYVRVLGPSGLVPAGKRRLGEAVAVLAQAGVPPNYVVEASKLPSVQTPTDLGFTWSPYEVARIFKTGMDVKTVQGFEGRFLNSLEELGGCKVEPAYANAFDKRFRAPEICYARQTGYAPSVFNEYHENWSGREVVNAVHLGYSATQANLVYSELRLRFNSPTFNQVLTSLSAQEPALKKK